MRSPIMAAAGAVRVADLLAADALGAVVTPSYTRRAHAGRPAVAHETVGGVLLSPATSSRAIGAVLKRQAPAWPGARPLVVVSLLVDERGEYAAAAAELEGVRGAAAIELNVAWGAADGLVAEDPALVRHAVRQVGQVCRLPVIVKLPFDLADPEATLAACRDVGAVAAVVAAGMPTGDGMYLGPATFPLVLELVRRLARRAPLPLVACGGVATAAQARAYLGAGAAAVQVGSAHLANPLAAVEIARELLLTG
jgi:dihydroorotate dehydrogenase (NAD+) catalytic subunit